MSLRIWALKIGELKPLSRGGLLLLSARCAMRVEPWLPQCVDALWREGLEYVTTAAFDEPALKKAIINSAKLSASIPAVLAHAERIVVPTGQNPVEIACLEMWNAIRVDILAVAKATLDIEAAKDRINSLRTCAPLWVDRTPTWAS